MAVDVVRPFEAAIRRFGSSVELGARLEAMLGGAPADAEWPPGRFFEYAVVRAFELEGAEVRYPYLVRPPIQFDGVASDFIEQIDGVVYCDGIAAMCEAKAFRSRVDVEPIAKLRVRLDRRPASVVGLLFTMSGITDAAGYILNHSHPRNILVWKRTEILAGISRGRMRQLLTRKFRYAVENGIYDYLATEELI
jgi:hypothetical protein